MSKKSGTGLEKHVDKIVLGAVGLIGLYVLYTFVLTSPWTGEYNGNKYNPADLDNAVREQARLVEDRLAKRPTAENSYQPRLGYFKSLLASPIKGIEDKAYFPLPYPGAAEKVTPIYEIPKVCNVDGVKAGLVESVAYVPAEPLEGDDSYAASETKLADLDVVTVEATIDAAQLSRRFEQSFGKAQNPAWAKPVFASVELERQESLDNGNWSEWQTVPRSKIGEFKSRFNIPQKVSKLDKSIDILMLQFDRPEIRAELLQPRTYDFAYPAESWLPPSLAEKRQVQLDKVKAEERRRRAEEASRRAEEERRSRTASRPAAGAGGLNSPSGDGLGLPSGPGAGGLGLPSGPGAGGALGLPRPAPTTRQRPRETAQPDASGRGTRSSRPAANKPTETFTEEQEFTKVKLTDRTDFATMKEPLLIWANDDTAEPGKTYRYRIRVGVFNPVAGTDSFNEKDKALRDDVILWSDYSQMAGPVSVPSRWYFFPLDYRAADKVVNMRVCRYLLAKWYAKDFRTKPGETIGTVQENVKNQNSGDHEPNEIDYSNGTILVDVVAARDGDYANALYAADAKTIECLGVKQQNWPTDLKAKFADIDRLQKEPAPVFAARSGESRRSSESLGLPGRGFPGPGTSLDLPAMPMPRQSLELRP
jgi:hypothetical protein